MLKRKKEKVNTAEKHIFKSLQDCSGGRGDKFLPRIVLIGTETISGRYFVLCSCFQGTAPAALSTDRMDGLDCALSSLPSLSCSLGWGESKWQSLWASLVLSSSLRWMGSVFPWVELWRCSVRSKPLWGFRCWDIRSSIIRRYICTSQVHQLLVPSSWCHRNATRGS